MTIRGPFAPGALTLRVTWKDGSQTLRYTVRRAVPDNMVRIPEGEFRMGSNTGRPNEKPVHTVYVDAFYMDIHEVTNAEYKKFIQANPQWQKRRINANFHDGDYLSDWNGNNYPAGKEDHPVVYVSWYAAMAYAKWAGKRLPTEAEWEKAARGDLTGNRYPWGNTIDADKANYGLNFIEEKPVGSYPANAYGLHDMAGNVNEWCLDAYNANFYANSPRRNPIAGAASVAQVINNAANVKNARVLRGGSWVDAAEDVQVSVRFSNTPAHTNYGFGFRCVMDE